MWNCTRCSWCELANNFYINTVCVELFSIKTKVKNKRRLFWKNWKYVIRSFIHHGEPHCCCGLIWCGRDETPSSKKWQDNIIFSGNRHARLRIGVTARLELKKSQGGLINKIKLRLSLWKMKPNKDEPRCQILTEIG